MTATSIARLLAVAAHAEKHDLGDAIMTVGVAFKPDIQLCPPIGERLAAVLAWVRTLGGDITIDVLYNDECYHVSATGALDCGMPTAVSAITHTAERDVVADAVNGAEMAALTVEQLAALASLVALDKADAAVTP